MKFHREESSHLRVENKTIFYPVWKSKLFLFQVGHYVHTMLWHHILQSSTSGSHRFEEEFILILFKISINP
jgi:hypothetical protein